MWPTDPEVLRSDEIVALAKECALPDGWRTSLGVSYLRPLLGPDDVVTVQRRPPERGDVVCLLSSASRLVWRRVVEGCAGALVVRADLAPVSEVWRGPVLGCVEPASIPQRIASRAPTLWGEGVWTFALALAHGRRLRARVLRRLPEAKVDVRVLSESELELAHDLLRTERGVVPNVGPIPPGVLVFGAFNEAGDLIARTSLITRRTPAWSGDTLVAREWRGRGVARRMLAAVLEHAWALGITEVRGSIRARNLASISACRAVGFRLVDEPREPNNFPEFQTWGVRGGALGASPRP